MDKTTLWETVRFYFETVISSAGVAATILALTCVLRNLTGQFTVPTFNLALFLGAHICWLMPKRTYNVFAITLNQVTLEIVLNQWNNPLSYMLLNSKVLQCFWFMLSSAVLMHFKRNRKYNGFWFIQPELKLNQDADTMHAIDAETEHMPNTQTKLHELKKFLLKDAKTYLTYGLVLDILSGILATGTPRKIQQIPNFIMRSLRNTNFKMTCFFVSYIVLYRLFLYFPSKTTNLKELTDFHHYLASFIGGASYIFVNRLTLNTFSFVLTVHVLWQNYCETPCNEKTKHRQLFEALKTFPFSKVIFPFCATYLISSFVLRNDSVNGLGKAFLRAVTDQKIQRIHDFVVKSTEEVIRNTALIPAMGVF